MGLGVFILVLKCPRPQGLLSPAVILTWAGCLPAPVLLSPATLSQAGDVRLGLL